MTRSMTIAGCAATLLLPAPALAQAMPGMTMDMPTPAKPKPAAEPKPRRTPSPAPARTEAPSHPHHQQRATAPDTATAPRPVPEKEDHLPQVAVPSASVSASVPMAMPGMAMDAGPAAYGEGSGTARNPGNDGAMHGVHVMAGRWTLMLHGYAWGVYTDQGGPRGANEAFAESMAMLAASRDVGPAHLRTRAMLSLEPAMGARGYPNLFATGETADGRTQLVDRQHPHDLFMELSARVDVDAGAGSVFLYGGPVAEPALGPSAFLHRGSARYQPLSPITHHWFDSTHISYGVVTAGYATPHWQVEASTFRGREPDEHRWNVETPALDSWSVRATWTPSPAWAVQASHGRLKSPEQLEPDGNEMRTTASVQYAAHGVSALLAWSRKDLGAGRVLPAWLVEANWDVDRRHSLFARAETLANDELFPDPTDPLHDRRFRVGRIEAGYAYRLPLVGPTMLALGGTAGVYARPAALNTAYGRFPVSFSLFAKLSLGN